MRLTNHRVQSYVKLQKKSNQHSVKQAVRQGGVISPKLVNLPLPDDIDIATYGDYDHGVGRSYDLEKEI